MRFLYKKIVFGFASLVFIYVPFLVSASTMSLSPATISVKEGQVFTITVGANGGGVPNYTVKMDAKFTPDVIRLQKWAFADAWIPLKQPGYDSFDNSAGTLVRTAGFSNGFTKNNVFGTATFTAGKAGQATIQLSDNTFIYDESSTNTYTGANKVIVNVGSAPVKTLPQVLPKPEVKPEIIDHTFDIASDISKSLLTKDDTLSATVHLVNLSKKIESLQVPIGYLIMDSNGAIVFEEQKTVSVGTANTRFEYTHALNNLNAGTYTLIAQVEYENMTQPAESKDMFTIEGPIVPTSPSVPTNVTLLLYIIIGVLSLIILVMALWHHHRRKI